MAVNFDASDDNITAASSSVLDLATQLSISAVINPDTVNVNRVIASKTSASHHQYEVIVSSSATIRVRGGNGTTTTDTVDSTTTLSAGTWYQVGAHFGQNGGSTDVAAVVSGVKENQTTKGFAIASSTSVYKVGKGFESLFDGLMEYVAVWNVALSVGEWKALGSFVNPRFIRPGNLVSYIDMSTPATCAVDRATFRAYTVTGTNQSKGSRVQQMFADNGLTNSRIISAAANTGGGLTTLLVG